MATVVTPQQRASIQERTIVYEPIYVNGMSPANRTGSYVLFYLFTPFKTKLTIQNPPNSCIVETLNKMGKNMPNTFVKIGNFSSGAKSRHESNKGDLIKNDGNRSPAARHSQDVLIANPELYMHFIMVVLSPDTVEANLERALDGIVDLIHNKIDVVRAPPGRWNPPVVAVRNAQISEKLSSRIAEGMKNLTYKP